MIDTYDSSDDSTSSSIQIFGNQDIDLEEYDSRLSNINDKLKILRNNNMNEFITSVVGRKNKNIDLINKLMNIQKKIFVTNTNTNNINP
jgi:hypothetical protein